LAKENNTKLVLISWAVMLVISSLPNIILGKLNIILSWLLYAKMLILLFLFVISFFYNKIFPLREYFGVFLAVFMTRELIIMVRATEKWHNWFGGNNPSFIQFKIREQLLLIVAIVIIYLVLLAIKKKPALFSY